MVPALSLATLSPLPAALIALLMISIPAASSVCVAAAANPTDAIKQPHRNCMLASRERRNVVEAGIQIVSETAGNATQKANPRRRQGRNPCRCRGCAGVHL